MSKLPIESSSQIPPCTGVYLFHDRHDGILYVGKAVNLRRRVAQHRQEARVAIRDAVSPARRKRILMASVRHVSWLTADTELEALLLEDDLIKRHRPPYNRRQNRFTRHAYLELSPPDTPPSVRVVEASGADHLFGPYTDRFYAERVAAVLDSRFGIPARGRGSLRAAAPRLAEARRFLAGDDEELVSAMREETTRLAEQLLFERAAAVRDEAEFCDAFLRRQKLVRVFTEGVLVVSETRPGGEELHLLFDSGALVERVRGPVPEGWDAPLPGSGPPRDEPRWLLAERALVVSAWISAAADQRRLRVVREGRS